MDLIKSVIALFFTSDSTTVTTPSITGGGLSEKTDISGSYAEYAIRTLRISKGELLELFFSFENVDHIQSCLIKFVKKERGIDIPRQNTYSLLNIMTTIYYNFTSDPRRVDLMTALIKMNQETYEFCAKRILLEIDSSISYDKYINGRQELMEPGIRTDLKGSRTAENSIGFESRKDINRANYESYHSRQ